MATAERFIVRPARLVSRSRIRAYAAMCLVVVVAEYLFALLSGNGLLDRFGQVKGTDFIQFYVAGRLVAAGHGAELYRFVPPFQFPAQFAAEAAVLDGQLTNPNFAFVVPPFFALLMVPFSRLPYLAALAAWIIFNTALLLATLRLLQPYVAVLRGRDRPLVYLAAAAFFPFLEGLFDGQNGVISLFFVALAYVALRRERDTLAGLALAAVLFKPQLVVTLALALLLARRGRTILALAGGGALLVGVSWLIVGTDGMRDYLSLSTTMPGWIYLPGWRVWNMHSWQSFFVLLFANPTVSRALTTVFSLATLAIVGYLWCGGPTSPSPGGEGGGEGVLMPDRARYLDTPLRPHPNPLGCPLGRERGLEGGRAYPNTQHQTPNTLFNLRFALAIIGTVLVSPHVFGYDLTLLILPGLLLADGLASGELERLGVGEVTRSALRLGLVLTFFAPLISRFLAMGLHLQLSVPIIAALFVASALALRQATAGHRPGSTAVAASLPGPWEVVTNRAGTQQIPSPRGRGSG